jgi:hypothetical protein
MCGRTSQTEYKYEAVSKQICKSSALKMEVTCPSETLLDFSQTTQATQTTQTKQTTQTT